MTALELNIPQKIFLNKYKGNKNIATNIDRIQACDSIMCGSFCIAFIGFMLKGQSLIFYYFFYHIKLFLFSPNKYEKNDKIKLKYFQ